jgi:capsule biosynthesis phosphatase
MATIVIDLDGTLTHEDPTKSYLDVLPRLEVVNTLRSYREKGFKVAIFTARNMKTHAKSVGAINAKTIPTILEWLKKHDIPFDELHVGKPWPERGGFYVDDRAIRPSEFVALSYDEILTLTGAKPEDDFN